MWEFVAEFQLVGAADGLLGTVKKTQSIRRDREGLGD